MTRLKDCTPDELMARMATQGARKGSDNYDWTLGLQTVKNARAQIRRITGLDNDQIKAWAVSGLTYAEWLEPTFSTKTPSVTAEAQGGPDTPADAPVVTEGQEEALATCFCQVAPSGGLIFNPLCPLHGVEGPEDFPDDHPIKQRLDMEISGLETEITRLDEQMAQLQADYDKAWKEGKFDNPKVDRCSDQVVKVLEAQKSINEKLDQLRNPAELERRMQDADAKSQRIERIKTVATIAKSKKETAREQGVPDIYLGDNGNFKPGLDARFKSDLVHAYLGLKSKEAKRTFTAQEAEAFLQARNWMPFVQQKRDAIERKEAKAAKSRAVKSAKTQGAAEAVTLAETETIAEQVAEQVAEIFVTPDPKPTRKPRSDKGKPRTRKS